MLIITPELFGNTWIRPELAREEARLNNQADASATSSSPSPAQTSGGEDYWGEDGFGFDDFLDLINPLQHLPVVSSIYRAITGDEAAPGARILGGALFGGPVGLLSAVLDNAVEEESGKPMVAHVAALFSGDEQPGDVQGSPVQETQVADVARQAPDEPTAHDAATPAPTLAVAKTTSSGTMPTLSPQAFATLMAAFDTSRNDDIAAKAANGREYATDNAQLTASVQPDRSQPHSGASPATAVPGDLARRMMDALDRYQAMKQAERSAADAGAGDVVDDNWTS